MVTMMTTPFNHVMLDLETLGTGPESAIVAIGAVPFNEDGVADKDQYGFYAPVTLASSFAAGMSIDSGAITFWMRQSDDARAVFNDPYAVDLAVALTRFSNYLTGLYEASGNEICVWGNGAAFDNVVLASAYRRCGIRQPWEFWNDRCYRTMKSSFDTPKPERKGTYHNALDDAMFQAEHLVMILQDNLIELN